MRAHIIRLGDIAIWFLLLSGQPAEARFLNSDADQIDRESQLFHENYNDKASYRPPVAWERLWTTATMGWWASAGSLSIDRFEYNEDIKFLASDDSLPFVIKYQQKRREDMIEERLEREIRFEWRVLPQLSLAWLADGGHRKEYGDMGGAIILQNSSGHHQLEFYYWEPDVYFATKKQYVEDSITQRTYTRGVRLLSISKPLRLTVDVAHDSPLIWQRNSQGYHYRYERRLVQGRLDWDIAGWDAYFTATHEVKTEHKSWNLDNAITYAQLMQRQVNDAEVGATYTRNHHEWTLALQAVRRDAHYQFNDERLDADPDADYDYAEVPERGRQRLNDQGLYLSDHFPLIDGEKKHFFQLGWYMNYVQRHLEVKLQTAYDVRIGTRGGMLLNATWDIDRLLTQQPFRPWGGGNIQFFVNL